MATITEAIVRVKESGQVVRSDCFGNNAAIECPHCLSYPVLLIARPDQHGTNAENPARCRHCGMTCYILDDVAPGDLEIINIVVNPPT